MNTAILDLEVTLEHEGKSYVNFALPALREAGVPAAVIGDALKATARSEVARVADSYRARLASASAGKLAEYRIKEEIARDPAGADAAELALIEREATARGLDQAGLLAEIAAKAAAYRQVALLIGALEAEASAAITAIPDTAPDIETQIQTALTSAKSQAEAAFADALALINGGA